MNCINELFNWIPPFLADSNDVMGAAQSLLTCVGLVFGGGFLIYKVWTGWLYVNMAVGIKTEREHASDPDSDHLVVSVQLDKGSIDSAFLKAIEIRLTRLNDQGEEDASEEQKCISILSFKPVGEPGNTTSVWKSNAHPKRAENGIALAPGEKTEHAGYQKVSRSGVYRVDLAVFGTRRFFEEWNGYLIQWRASAVSLPIKDEERGKSGQ